jgi:hypothetical protein
MKALHAPTLILHGFTEATSTPPAASTFFRPEPDNTSVMVCFYAERTVIRRDCNDTEKNCSYYHPKAEELTTEALEAAIASAIASFPDAKTWAKKRKVQARAKALNESDPNSFLGWMRAASKYSPAIAKEIDAFLAHEAAKN